MIEYNYLLNDIIFSKISNIVSLKLFLFIIIAFLISFFIDIIFGELPTRIHHRIINQFFQGCFHQVQKQNVRNACCIGSVYCFKCNFICYLHDMFSKRSFMAYCFFNTSFIHIFHQNAAEHCC